MVNLKLVKFQVPTRSQILMCRGLQLQASENSSTLLPLDSASSEVTAAFDKPANSKSAYRDHESPTSLRVTVLSSRSRGQTFNASSKTSFAKFMASWILHCLHFQSRCSQFSNAIKTSGSLPQDISLIRTYSFRIV